jgi:hypothetical protein
MAQLTSWERAPKTRDQLQRLSAKKGGIQGENHA